MTDDLGRVLYPDIIDMVTDQRFHLGGLQYVAGVTVTESMVHQSFEVLVLLQSLVQANMRVMVGVNPLHEPQLEIGKTRFTLGLRAGEVGVLHVPVTPLAVPDGGAVTLGVSVRYRMSPRVHRLVRMPNGGVRPPHLNISPFRLGQLRSAHYNAQRWHKSPETSIVSVQVRDEALPYMGETPAYTYETLWSDREMHAAVPSDRTYEQALQHVPYLDDTTVYNMLYEQVEMLFVENGLMLYQAEIRAIAVLLYARLMSDVRNATLITLLDRNWFQLLAQHIHCETSLPREEKSVMVAGLFEAILYDALRWGCEMLHSYDGLIPEPVRGKCGYELLFNIGRLSRFSLRMAYYPLVLGGVAVSATPDNSLKLPTLDKPELVQVVKRRRSQVHISQWVWVDILDRMLGH